MQLSYAIGVPHPLSIYCDTYGTLVEDKKNEDTGESELKLESDKDLVEIIKNNFDLRPGCIVRDLNLKKPIFRKTASYGHFGRDDSDFTWETPKELKL